MYKVVKDKIEYVLRDEIQLSAFLNSGYELLTKEAPKNGSKNTSKNKNEDK